MSWNTFGAWLFILAACSPTRLVPELPATPASQARSTSGDAPEVTTLIDAGLECIHAKASCELAACRVEVHNECPAPIECVLDMIASCDDEPQPRMVKASARDSLLVDSATTLDAAADCGSRKVTGSRVDAFHCR